MDCLKNPGLVHAYLRVDVCRSVPLFSKSSKFKFFRHDPYTAIEKIVRTEDLHRAK